MKALVAWAAAIGLTLSMTGSAVAADVTNYQIRVVGAEGNYGDAPWSVPEDAAPGIYTGGLVQAYVATDSRPGQSVDWIYVSVAKWEKLPSGDWELLSDVSGYAADGAAGLTIDAGNLSWAKAHATIDVGWCRSYETEDTGGGCTDYVVTDAVHLDLTWTPTTRLLTSTDQQRYAWPSHWLNLNRRTSHYRDAVMTGTISSPVLGQLAVSSAYALLDRWSAGQHEVVVR